MLDKHTVSCEQAGALVLIDVYMLPWPRLSSCSLRHQAAQLACHRKVIRLAAVTAAVAAYAQLRSWLAGDHLVRIYRKVSGRGVACSTEMLELDVYHMHDLGHTSCHAVDCIPFLLDVLKAFSGHY